MGNTHKKKKDLLEGTDIEKIEIRKEEKEEEKKEEEIEIRKEEKKEEKEEEKKEPSSGKTGKEVGKKIEQKNSQAREMRIINNPKTKEKFKKEFEAFTFSISKLMPILKKLYYPSEKIGNLEIRGDKETNIFNLPRVLIKYLLLHFLPTESISNIGKSCKRMGKIVFQLAEEEIKNQKSDFEKLYQEIEENKINLNKKLINKNNQTLLFIKKKLLKMIIFGNLNLVSSYFSSFFSFLPSNSQSKKNDLLEIDFRATLNQGIYKNVSFTFLLSFNFPRNGTRVVFIFLDFKKDE